MLRTLYFDLLPDSHFPALMYTKPPRGMVGLLLGMGARGKSWASCDILVSILVTDQHPGVREDILKTLLNTLPRQGVSQLYCLQTPDYLCAMLCHHSSGSFCNIAPSNCGHCEQISCFFFQWFNAKKPWFMVYYQDRNSINCNNIIFRNWISTSTRSCCDFDWDFYRTMKSSWSIGNITLNIDKSMK